MAEQEDNSRTEAVALRHRFHRLISELETSSQSRLDASSNFCQDFCQVLMDHVRQWRSDEDRLPLLQMYIVAIVCYAEASPSLCPECEHVADVLEKLSWSCLDLLLSFSEQIPGALWEEFQSSVKVAHGILQARGSSQLHTLSTLAEENGVWTNITLNSLLSNNMPDVQKVHSFLAREGPELLHMRIKNLIKQKLAREAALLAKACAEFPEFGGKKNFKQIYLVCLCEIKSQQELMQEIKEVDCKDALDMICNLESEEDEKGALSLCTAFFKRQLLHGDVYCAWELTLFWSKLLIRLESEKAFLDQCRLLARLSGSVYHILLLIKVIQAEVEKDGLSVCIEMCIQALKMGLQNSEDCNITIYKTISCLLPLDLEVKRACQLTEFLVKPSVDSYYAVEMLFNQPDQKLEEDNLPILNSLRCELLLALKTKWPFDPEFWDWRTLKRHCLALMSHEATVILSEDKFSDSEENEPQDCDEKQFSHPDLTRSPTYELNGIEAERKRKREMKKLRERGFVSARFRNWQAYMQYCVLCDKEFLGHRIVKHALKHVQDGIFHCPICAKKFETRVILEPHVASHVKQSCRERLAAMNASKKCPGFSKLTPAGSTLQKQQDYSNNPVKCSQGTTLCNKNSHDLNRSTSTTTTSKIRSSSLRQVKPNWDVKRTEDCSCPVTSCQKVFKYFRNLVAHVKAHKNEMEAKHFLEVQNQKALCQYCHRQFVNVTHLNDHLQMHCGEKPYFCIQLGCNCSFSSYAELLTHRKLHAEFQAKCTHPNCERIFNETYLLYDHEAHHYMTFSCKSKNCGKSFYSLSELNLHQKEHAKQDQSVVDEGPHSQRHTPAQTCIVLELSPNQINEISQEPSPVKLKCSEGILDNTSSSTEQNPVSCTAQLSVIDNDSQTGYTSDIQPEDGSKTSHFSQNESSKQLLLESCYVKLEPIPISCDDPIFLNALRSADSVTQTLLKDKKLFSFPWSQLKHSTLKSSFSMTVANGEENTNHMCPLETCTRKYSTSKSLSRHIKNVHSEVFEEWKLLKKYKRIAEISARKFSSAYTPTSSQILQKLTSCSTQTCEKGEEIGQNGCPDSTFLRAPSFFSGHDVMQPSSVKFCTQLESTQSDTSSNQTELMQLPISQTWTTASLDNMDSGFSVQNHLLATNLSDNQLTYSYHSDVHLDYTFASGNDSMMTCSVNARTPLSAMNESSKYVSSSLRVLHALNGDHTCDLTQIKSSDDLEYNQMGPNHSNDISVDASLLHNGCLPGQNTSAYFSTLPAEESAISVQLQGNSNQEFNTDCTDTLFSSDIKYMSDVITTHFIEQSKDFSVSAIPLTDEKSPKELLLESTEGLPSDEKMVLSSVETKKTKKVRSSKRTKWPAILKDGKVICCRCYREFSSTKSLGGHLSKRSQCKPVDEIDLTADLPTSFLDFLNDPDISTVQMSLPTNIKHEQNHKSVTYPLAESNFIYSNSLTSMHDTDCSIQNTCLFSQDPPEIIINSTACNPAVPDEDAKSKLESENTGEDGKVIEIERALQRLDIVDILSLDTLVFENSDLHNLSSKTDVSNNNCQTVRDNVEGNEQKTILKPFRCNEDCTYGAMTKEALFKHLCRVHDYSEERINDMKKNPHKLAPYNCHLCSKTFTRTTGLKIHYTNVHHFSKEDMSRLEILCGRKGKKSSVSGDMHSSLITKQGNSFQLEVSKAIKSESSNDREVTNVGTRKRKNPIQDSLTVSSAETCKPVEASQKSLVSRLSARDTKPLQGPSLTTEDHSNESDQTDIVSMQELTSGGNPYPIGPLNTPNKGTKDGTVQLHRKTKTNSIVVVDLQERKKEMLKESEDNIDSGDSSDALSLYRPYRCVHEGCVAAFSIQQNLILHYRAMHQSDKDESTGFIAKDVDETVRKQEYRCQVKECSKVVSKVTSLLKHYLLLHRCTLEKASTLLSGVEVGTFQCDQSKCSAHFTCHLKYIDHIKNHHKAIRVSADGDFESVDLTFKCQCEGCDRVYTTKSNLLRHLMKKHHSTFETMKEKQKNGERDDIQTKKINSSPDPNNGKENIANNKNIKVRKTKNLKREDRAQNHWLTFEKPSLKSIDEASAICNRRFPLQYPCMIKSCDSVMSAEQNILKHYTTHGLTERYVEDQRNCFIFCKKSKEITRPESTPEDFEIDKTDLEEETQKSKVSSLEVYPEIGLQTEMEVLVNDSFTATSIPVVKRKRGRPRKSKCSIKLYQEHKEGHRNCSGDQVKCMLKVSGSTMNSSNYQDDLVGDALKLYRPLEFETSVKFIEDSSTRNSAKRKTRRGDLGSKRQRTFQPSTNIIYENSNVQDRDKQCVVNFRNPLKIESVNNVKIVMYENISTCSDLLLKQLQDMQPLVILKKWLHS